MQDHLVRPNKWYYLIVPVGFIIAAVVSELVFAYILELQWDDYAQKYTLPGSHEIEFHKKDAYLIFYEHLQFNEGDQVRAPATLPNISMNLASENGQAVPIHLVPPEESPVALGNRTILLMGSFTIVDTGRYRFSAGYTRGIPERTSTLSIGPTFPYTLIVLAAITRFGPYVFVLLALLSPISIWRKRKKTREPKVSQYARKPNSLI